MNSPLIPNKKAGAYLGLASGTLNVLRCRGTGAGLIPYVVNGSRKFYLQADLDAYIQAQRVTPAERHSRPALRSVA